MHFPLDLRWIPAIILIILGMISISSTTLSPNEFSEEQYRSARNGVIDPKARWKKFYVFVDPEFNNTERAMISKVMSTLQEILPCVKFWMWPSGISPTGYNRSFVHIQKSNSECSSDIGRNQNGSQVLKLDPKCTTNYTILHEMIHTLGLHHEQSRPDRDNYVSVYWKNIIRGDEKNFKKYDTKEVSAFGVPYNPKSLMHYSSKAFSANGEPTMLTKSGGFIERPKTLQFTDILKLKRMYNC